MTRLLTLIFTLYLTVLSLSSLTAQDIVMEDSLPPMDERIAWIFENLDFTDVTSGVLYDYGLNLEDFKDFPGDTITGDTADFERFTLMYATLAGSIVDSNLVIIDPADLYMDGYFSFSKGGNIPLAGMVTPYQYFHPDAIDSGWISYTAEQFYDVLPRGSSPYLTDTTFIFTPMFPSAVEGEVKLRFDTTHIWIHPDLSIASWSADLGAGFVSLQHGTVYNLSLSPGSYLFRFRAELSGGKILESRSLFEVVPQIQASYPSNPDINFSVTGATVSGFSACGDGEVRKPLIWIEGFNPDIGPKLEELTGDLGIGLFQNLAWNNLRVQLLNFVYNGNSLWSLFESNEYDLFYIDFSDGAGDMFANADAVRAAIEEINTRKAAAGSTHKNIVIGESMGGVLGKMALRDMEIEEEDHETEKLISFDSPFQGANIPLAYQFALFSMSELKIGIFGIGGRLKKYIPALSEAMELLDKPASKQLLINHVKSSTVLTERQTFINHLNTIGNLDIDHIALANGAIDATQIYSPATTFFAVDINGGQALSKFTSLDPSLIRAIGLFASKLATGGRVDMDLKALPSFSTSFTRFGEIKIVLFVLGAPLIAHKNIAEVKNRLPIDGAPGGVIGSTIPTEVLSLITTAGGTILNPNQFAFVPAFSALNLESPFNEDLSIDLSDIEQVLGDEITLVSRYSGSTDDWPVHPGASSQRNQYHVRLYADNVGEILSELDVSSYSSSANFSNFSSVYNFGKNVSAYNSRNIAGYTANQITKNVNIQNNGVIHIGKNAPVANMHISNPEHDESGFAVMVHVGCDEETIVTVHDGGSLQVGDKDDSDYQAQMQFQLGTKLEVQLGGELEVNSNSKLILGSGSECTIFDSGFLDAKWGAQVILKEDSEMRVKSGGILRISHYSSLIIEPGSTLILEDGAVLQLWDGQDPDGDARIEVRGNLQIEGDIVLTGNGYFDFYGGHTLSIIPSTLTLAGMGKTFRLIRLNSTTLDLHGKHVDFQHFKIHYHGYSEVHCGDNTNVKMSNLLFQNIQGSSIGVICDDHRSIQVRECDFEEFSSGLVIYGYSGTFPIYHTRISGSTFHDCDEGILLSGLDQASISGVTITDNHTGLICHEVDQVYVFNSIITGCTIGIEAAVDAPPSQAPYVNRIVVNGGLIDDNEYGIAQTTNTTTSYNLVLTNGVVISNNETGVYILEGSVNEQGYDQGVVIIDCARFIDNETGILGQDILLLMDAHANSGSSDPQDLRSNIFVCDPGEGHLLFDICYENRAMSQLLPIPAKGNYWDPLPQTDIGGLWNVFKIKACVGSAYPPTPVDFSSNVTLMPSSCPVRRIEIDPQIEECLVMESTAYERELNNLYFEAFTAWITELELEEFTTYDSDWHLLFEDLYMLVSMTDSFDAACNHLIYGAGAFVTETSLFARPQNNQDTSTVDAVYDSGLTVYPNPSGSSDFIRLNVGGPVPTREDATIQIYDILGNVVWTIDHKPTHSIDISIPVGTWSPGIYLISYMSHATRHIEVCRWIKQE